MRSEPEMTGFPPLAFLHQKESVAFIMVIRDLHSARGRYSRMRAGRTFGRPGASAWENEDLVWSSERLGE